MQTIPKQIDEIIARRKGVGSYEGVGHLDLIQNKITFYENLSSVLNDYLMFRDTVIYQIESKNGEYFQISEEDPFFSKNVYDADPSKVIKLVEQSLQECRLLEKRFSRDYLNISVIGRARQGKSCLLQSLSGLEDDVIPASNGGDCTGAKSIILNSKGKTYAKVVFYSEIEILNQIQKYLDTIKINKKIGSILQIPALKSEIDIFESELSSKTGREQSLFEHLKKYIYYFNEYSEYIGTEHEEKDITKIRNYVAQYDCNMKATYAFLAVKEVQIYTEFPNPEVGKIVLVDTIGLGDTSLGIREKMVNTLREDSDAAILVRLPSANGDGIRVEDDELYDLICEAMGNEALNKWLFFALNVCDYLNNHNSGDAMEQSLLNRKLNYAFAKKVDCHNAEEVENKLLTPILEYLSNNLVDVDNNLMLTANKTFNNAFKEYVILFQKIQNVISGTFKKETNGFGALFDDVYGKKLQLSYKLALLNDKYDKIKNSKCVEISKAIMSVISTFSALLPQKTDILNRLMRGDKSANFHNVYNHYADTLRPAIANKFEEINSKTIDLLQNSVKSEIIDVLLSVDGGRLSFIHVPQNAEHDINDNDTLKKFNQFIEFKLKNDYSILYEAFDYILSYRLNIEGLLEYKVNNCLVCLIPGSSEFVALNDFEGSLEEKAECIEQSLRNAIDVVAEELIDNISEFLSIPYNSFYARIRKFREKIIFSEEGQAQLKNFYRDNCSSIWNDEFTNAANAVVAVGAWNDYKNKIEKECDNKLFNIKLL